MKRIHYYSSDESLEPRYIKNSEEGLNLFALFAIVCIQMKKNKHLMSEEAYIK